MTWQLNLILYEHIRAKNPEAKSLRVKEAQILSKQKIVEKYLRASLGDTPKMLIEGDKRVAPSPPEDRIPKKGKGSTLSTYAAATRGQTPQKDGEWKLVEKKKKEKKINKKKEQEVPVPSALCIVLGKPDLGDQCRLYKRFGGVQTAVVRLNEADARSLSGSVG